MKKQVYILEVGVHLNENDDEYDCYGISGATPKTEFGYYDENRIMFLGYDKAKEYADNYVKNGVNTTYGFIYSDIYNLTKEDIEDIENYGWAEYDLDTPNITEWEYYTYKKENGEIVTPIDDKNNIFKEK